MNLLNLGQEVILGSIVTITREAEVPVEVEAKVEAGVKVETMEGSVTAGDV